MNTFKTISTAFVVCVALLLSAAGASAFCDQTAASQADRDLWDTHGCWQDFFLWQYLAYDLNGAEWSGRGWNDACNVRLEYPKHWNASYLVTYGLVDNYYQSFHGTVDYRATAEAAASNFHDHIHHTVGDTAGLFGSYGGGVVTTYCPLYSSTHTNGNPASRAGDFMHEGWHAWLDKYNWYNGPNGGHWPSDGTCDTNSCDYFYFHGVSEYLFGDLWTTDGTANRFHSPNQVQVEFLCDVADQPQWWVPRTVRDTAAVDANTRAAHRFINGPGYTCGSPRPW